MTNTDIAQIAQIVAAALQASNFTTNGRQNGHISGHSDRRFTAKPRSVRRKNTYAQSYEAARSAKVPADRTARDDYRIRRLATIARGFERRGLTLTFDAATGRFDNVKPYRTWLSEGYQVRKGEKSVRGFFHITQCDKVPVVAPVDTTNLKVGDVVA